MGPSLRTLVKGLRKAERRTGLHHPRVVPVGSALGTRSGGREPPGAGAAASPHPGRAQDGLSLCFLGRRTRKPPWTMGLPADIHISLGGGRGQSNGVESLKAGSG